MNEKKAKKFDYEKKRSLFFWIGLCISLVLVISAFEWKSEYDTEIMKYTISFDPTDELIPITINEPPKPKIIAPKIIAVQKEEDIEPPIVIIDLTDITDKQIKDIIDSNKIPVDPPEPLWIGVVESTPEPINVFQQFYAFVGKNLKYPKKAQRMGIEGKVFVQFIIDEFGNITELKVIRGIGSGCDEEALRVMRLLPSWIPGKQRGKPVKVRMVLPLTFKLSM